MILQNKDLWRCFSKSGVFCECLITTYIVGKPLIFHESHIDKQEGLSEFHNLDQEDENKPASPSLHPAAGLGIDVAACGSVGCVDFSSINASEISKVEEHYKKMVEENPCNPLFLRNYAQFLFQVRSPYPALSFLMLS